VYFISASLPLRLLRPLFLFLFPLVLWGPSVSVSSSSFSVTTKHVKLRIVASCPNTVTKAEGHTDLGMMACSLDPDSSPGSDLQAECEEDKPIGLLSLPPEVLLQVMSCTFAMVKFSQTNLTKCLLL
jgi:hypothetical protein